MNEIWRLVLNCFGFFACPDEMSLQEERVNFNGTKNNSVEMRQKGNGFYKQACNGGFGPFLRKTKFEAAQRCYLEALAMKRDKDEESSCYKNMGALHFQWCKFEFELHEGSSKNPGNIKFHLAQSVEFNLQALHHGTSKTQEWKDQVKNSLINMIQWAAEESEPFSLLRSICQALLESVYKSTCNVVIVGHKVLAECMFKQGIKEFCNRGSSDYYKKCLNIMHNCHQPLTVAQELVSSLDADEMLVEELRDLKEQVYLYVAMCESIQARVKGDGFVDKALHEDEEIQMDYAWDAIDMYKQAALLTRERDVENEALAMSRMGKLYSEVIKDGARAHKCHFQATRLALSITNICPRIVTEDWYIYSNKRVQEHQRQAQEDEDREHHKTRAPILLKLNVELKTLARKASESAESFLKYIYEKHPNPDSTKQHLGSLEKSMVKATLKKAILHYHPDHNKHYGEQWCVLCEEIVKYLNIKYEYYK